MEEINIRIKFFRYKLEDEPTPSQLAEFIKTKIDDEYGIDESIGDKIEYEKLPEPTTEWVKV